MVSRTFCSFLLLIIGVVSAQSDTNDSPDLSGGLLAGGIFPPELLAGNSLRQVFSNSEVSDAVKGLQSLFGSFSEPKSTPTASTNQEDVPVPDVSTASNEMFQTDGAVDSTEAKPEVMPVRLQMLRPFPMPSIRSLFQNMQNSYPMRVHVIPFGNGVSNSPDFFPISRPLKSVRALAQGAPLFSRTITISSDGTKTVRQETSRDRDGNLVTTTTTTTTTTQRPDETKEGPMFSSSFGSDASFGSDSSNDDASYVDASAGSSVPSAEQDPQVLFKSVMQEMPAELKDLLGLTNLAKEFESAWSESSPESSSVQVKSRTPEVDQASSDDLRQDDADVTERADDNGSADDKDSDDDDDNDSTEDGVLDAVLGGDDEDSKDDSDGGEDEKNEDSKPYVVEIEKNSLDTPTIGAVLNAVADKLNILPEDMEIVDKSPTDDSSSADDDSSSADDTSSVKAWQQAGATSVETAHHDSSSDAETVNAEEQAAYAAAKLDALMSDDDSKDAQSVSPSVDDVLLSRLEALESRLQ